MTLLGGSGTMGFQAFQELRKRSDRYDVTLLLLPGDRRAKKLMAHLKAAGVPLDSNEGVREGEGVRVVWGDATRPEDAARAVQGADWVLNAMAYISPQADYRPALAWAVNDGAVGNVLDAILAEPGGAERIRYVHTGTVAQTGNRPAFGRGGSPGTYVGRVGDPMNPSVYDAYALSKIAGERRVMESALEHWVSLRMTFIMPTDHADLMNLFDPIAFHMPLDTRMENITDRNAGLAMVNCLDVADDGGFWRRAYNVGGGQGMRTTARAYLRAAYGLLGLDLTRCMESNWFALRNFHLQYFEDSDLTDSYLHYQLDDGAAHDAALETSMSPLLKGVRWLALRVPPFRRVVEWGVHASFKRLAQRHPNSPRYWYLHRNDARVRAFFGGYEEYEAIAAGGVEEEGLPDGPWSRLEHGYDEQASALSLADLQGAAEFRGGECRAADWDGDRRARLPWRCAAGHEFEARVDTVLRGGHWCDRCLGEWDGGRRALLEPFFAQAWHADHDPDELEPYPAAGVEDVANADEVWKRRGRPKPAA
ncbi:MAG TPA: NAD-dependent epimerase/dehydratase family protein [Trueperaceae bacterium]|nr:NAD-dependent epimerase/dehydratase family protein [Trueperaceae bacterium]